MSSFDELFGLISSQIKVISRLFHIAALEAKLMKLSIYPLLITLSLLPIVMITTWFTSMSLVAYGLYLILHNTILSLSAVLFINFTLGSYLLYFLKQNLRLMSFEKTRHYLYPMQEKATHHESTKTHSSDHSNAGDRITSVPESSEDAST